MMWWDGSWTWMWFAAVPMMLLVSALTAVVLVPLLRDRRGRPASPHDRLDERLASGEISVDEHRSRRSALERRS